MELDAYIPLLQALGEVGFPIAFAFIMYLTVRTLVPILQETFTSNGEIVQRMVVLQEDQKEILRQQAVRLGTIEQRLYIIEKKVLKDG